MKRKKNSFYCPKCGGTGLIKINSEQYNCKICKKYTSIKRVEEFNVLLAGQRPEQAEPATGAREEFTKGKDFINIIAASDRVLTAEDLIKKYNIDPDKWEVDSYTVKTSEGYRKDRRVEWDVKDGRVTNGSVRDSGKMLVVPLYHIRVNFKLRKAEQDLKLLKDLIIEEMRQHAPKYVKIKYKHDRARYLLEVDMPDLHLGKQTWKEESGANYGLKITEKMALDHTERIIERAQGYEIDRVLYPLGNDYFNVNSKNNTTINNTPQQEDNRGPKTFVKGKLLAVKIIDLLSQLAPVDVVVVVGNHDEEKTFYLGDTIESWYRLNDSVTVDNRPIKRKYYSYGKNLIGFTHGDKEKLAELPYLMALEQPERWAASKFREWQTGDKHHKKEIVSYLKENENKGVMIRILRSLSAADAWHFDKGYIGAQRTIEAFIRQRDLGLISQFNSKGV